MLLFSGVWAWNSDLFLWGVTDLVISVYMLFGFLALSWRKFAWAGVLFGFALGCKLLPGGFLVVIIALWLWRRDGFLRFTVACSASAVALLAPYVLWDSKAFLSSTVLYFLTLHGGGDDTSLWFLLAERAQGLFLGAGALLIGVALLRVFQTKEREITLPI
jgi:hypothetical protein